MIRATIAHEDKPIYGLSWSPEDSMVNPQYQLSIMTKFCHSRVKQIRFLLWAGGSCLALLVNNGSHHIKVQVAYAAGPYVCVEPTESAVSKPLKWLALEENAARAGAVVLAVDWSTIHRHLVTAGEDCRCDIEIQCACTHIDNSDFACFYQV